jgi:RND family efflux transporter MFP subunit
MNQMESIMSRILLVPGLLLLGLLGARVPMAAPPEPAEHIVVKHCILEYSIATQMGAPVPGVIQDCLVQLGQSVQAGQVLGRLHDQELRVELELRTAEAESTISIKAAQTKHALALAKLRTAEGLRGQLAISSDDYKVLLADVETTRLDIDDAKHKRQLAQIQSRQTQAALRVRELVSPHDGVVVAIYKVKGESVTFPEPIFRIVRVACLRVTGYADANDAWRVRPGQVVKVWPEIAGSDLAITKDHFRGQVVFVDSEIDPRTRTCKVVAEIDNRDNLLRSGLDARMEILCEKETPGKPREPSRSGPPLPTGR